MNRKDSITVSDKGEKMWWTPITLQIHHFTDKWPWCEIDCDFFEILFTLANTDKSLLITQRGVVFKSLPHLPGAIELRIDK